MSKMQEMKWKKEQTKLSTPAVAAPTQTEVRQRVGERRERGAPELGRDYATAQVESCQAGGDLSSQKIQQKNYFLSQGGIQK